MKPEADEKEFLQYRSNHTPRILRFAWTALIVFSIYYVVKFVWPDLVEWMTKIK